MNDFVQQQTRIWIGGQTYEARLQLLRDPEPIHLDELRNSLEVGWYVNVFSMRTSNLSSYLSRAKEVFASREVYYETDLMEASKREDDRNLQMLQNHGFRVVKIAVNRAGHRGMDGLRGYIDWARVVWTANLLGKKRRVVVMLPPWLTADGDLMTDDPGNVRKREMIEMSDGSATDGPMTLWAKRPEMRSASISQVKYTNTLVKQASIMMAPNEFPGHEWFDTALKCVMAHCRPKPMHIIEPFDLVFSYYGPACFHHCPVWPESWQDTSRPVSCTRGHHYDDVLSAGQRKPAQTFLGAAWWALKYLTEDRQVWRPW
jgi:hypothetical protein